MSDTTDPLCGAQARRSLLPGPSGGFGGRLRFECDCCGVYDITPDAMTQLEAKPNAKGKVRAEIAEERKRDSAVPLVTVAMVTYCASLGS